MNKTNNQLQNSRTINSFKNAVVGLIGQIFLYLISFICRTVFIYQLGVTYLGVSGLFSNILSILSLAELGVGSAITFSLYKPLAERDLFKVKALMGLYARAYRLIGCVVATVGLLLVPFLDYLIKDKPDIPELTVIYLLYVANTVFSYFFIYKSSIIIADQKNYIYTLNQILFSFIQYGTQIIILLAYKNFLGYLTVQVVCTVLANISISLKANKLYPYINGKISEKLDPESRKDIFKKIRAMMFHRIGSVVVLGTDNLLISAFIGVYWVGIYSNYVMLIGIVKNVIRQIFTSITASIGNLNVLETKEKSFEAFNTLYLLNFWIYSFCSIQLFILLNPFIKLWIGESYTLNSNLVMLIILNFYISGMRQNVQAFKDSIGLFWNDRHRPIVESVINLIASLILLKYFGIAGVFLGTLISTVTTCLWQEPYILYKHRFQMPLFHYFRKYIIYFLITIGIIAILLPICNTINKNDWISFVKMFVISVVFSNILLVVLFFRTKEFRDIVKRLKYIFVVLKKSN